MEVQAFKPEGDEVFEASSYENNTSFNEHDLAEVLSPANLDIAEDEWNLLIRTDPELAGQVGNFLLKRNKSLEMLIGTTEQCAEEHRIRANHYEKQIGYMRGSMEQQTKTLENFERQVHELTLSYKEMTEECRQYKERNKSLWEVVASLEEKCEEYLVELELLKSSRPFGSSKDDVSTASKDSPCSEDVLSPMSPLDEDGAIIGGDFPSIGKESDEGKIERDSDIISLKMYAEETNRKHEIERCQRLNAEVKLQRACAENKDLRDHIKFLEHRLKIKNRENENEEVSTENGSLGSAEKGGKSLIRSRSLTSLCDVDDHCHENRNNIQYEVDALHRSRVANRNMTIRLAKDKNNDVADGGSTNEKLCISCRMTSSAAPLENNSTVRESDGLSKENNSVDHAPVTSAITKTADISKPVGGVSNTISTTVGKPVTGVSSTMSPTVENYRDMFAEIFEKLKISRPAGAGGRPM